MVKSHQNLVEESLFEVLQIQFLDDPRNNN